MAELPRKMTVPKRAGHVWSAALYVLASACASETTPRIASDASSSSEAGEWVSDAALTDDASASPDGGSVPADGESARLDADSSELPLIDHKSWHNFAAQLDPLAGHQPAVIACGIAGWFIEREQLEVSTADCNYALLEHPSLLAIEADTEVLVELWHFDLNAPEPAQAHVALLFGDALQWETFIPIPSPGNVQQVSFKATRALDVGDPIRLHLHNHGQNTWLLRSVHALAPTAR